MNDLADICFLVILISNVLILILMVLWHFFFFYLHKIFIHMRKEKLVPNPLLKSITKIIQKSVLRTSTFFVQLMLVEFN